MVSVEIWTGAIWTAMVAILAYGIIIMVVNIAAALVRRPEVSLASAASLPFFAWTVWVGLVVDYEPRVAAIATWTPLVLVSMCCVLVFVMGLLFEALGHDPRLGKYGALLGVAAALAVIYWLIPDYATGWLYVEDLQVPQIIQF